MIWYHFWIEKRYWILGVLTFAVLLNLFTWRELLGYSTLDVTFLTEVSATVALLTAALVPWGVLHPSRVQFGAQYTFSLPVSRFHWVVTRTLMAWTVVAAVNATTVVVQAGAVAAAGHGEWWPAIAWNGWLHTLAVLPVLGLVTIGQFIPAAAWPTWLPIFVLIPRIEKISQWLSEESLWRVEAWALALTGLFFTVAAWGARRREF
jgi:hypothetical protein